MSTAQIRADILRQLKEADDRTLKAVQAMLKAYAEADADPIVGYDEKGNPQYASVLGAELREDLRAAKKGKSISSKELKNRSDQWLTDMK